MYLKVPKIPMNSGLERHWRVIRKQMGTVREGLQAENELAQERPVSHEG